MTVYDLRDSLESLLERGIYHVGCPACEHPYARYAIPTEG
jgi:hypothetical protein